MTIRAIIFDFDGTILDTESPDFETWQEIYESHQCTLTMEDWSRCVGTTYHSFNPFDHLEQQLGCAISREGISRRHRTRFVERVRAKQLSEGVSECLEFAKAQGLKLGVASSSEREWVNSHLTSHNLISYFDSVRTAEDVQAVKPEPDLYLAVLSDLEVSAGETIAIEDSPNGVTAATRAGIFCIAVPNAVTAQLSLDHASLRLERLSVAALEQVLNRT